MLVVLNDRMYAQCTMYRLYMYYRIVYMYMLLYIYVHHILIHFRGGPKKVLVLCIIVQNGTQISICLF